MPLEAVIAMLRKVSPPPPRNGSPFAVHSRITFTDSSGDTPWSWISCRVVMCMKSAPELRQILSLIHISASPIGEDAAEVIPAPQLAERVIRLLEEERVLD